MRRLEARSGMGAILHRESPRSSLRDFRSDVRSTRGPVVPSLRRDVGGGDAAVDGEGGAGEVRGLVGSQEQGGSGDLDGLAEAAQRDVHEATLALLFRVEELHQQLGAK